MVTTRKIKLANFLKVVLDIIFGMLVISCAGLVLWIAGFSLISSQADYLGTASIPVILSSGEEDPLNVTLSGTPKDNINAAFLSETEGTLRLETDSALLIGIANAAKLIVAIGLAYCTYLLRAVVQSIRDGEFFSQENPNRLRRLGYAVLILGFLVPSVQYIAATEILHRLPTTVPELSPGPSFEISTVLIALFILLLVHIWSYGLELERDRALTI